MTLEDEALDVKCPALSGPQHRTFPPSLDQPWGPLHLCVLPDLCALPTNSRQTSWITRSAREVQAAQGQSWSPQPCSHQGQRLPAPRPRSTPKQSLTSLGFNPRGLNSTSVTCQFLSCEP